MTPSFLQTILGLAGGSLFAYAAVPQAIRTIRAGRHLGVPLDLVAAILGGTVAMYGYLTWTRGFDWVLAVNYSVEAASWGVLGFYRLFRRQPILETISEGFRKNAEAAKNLIRAIDEAGRSRT